MNQEIQELKKIIEAKNDVLMSLKAKLARLEKEAAEKRPDNMDVLSRYDGKDLFLVVKNVNDNAQHLVSLQREHQFIPGMVMHGHIDEWTKDPGLINIGTFKDVFVKRSEVREKIKEIVKEIRDIEDDDGDSIDVCVNAELMLGTLDPDDVGRLGRRLGELESLV